jgi:hypothetical protein
MLLLGDSIGRWQNTAMTLSEIHNADDLLKWVTDRKTDQVGIIATRIAMRALPAIEELQIPSLANCAILVFRALLTGWASANSPENFSRSARVSANNATHRLLQSLPPADLSAFPVVQASFIANEISLVAPKAFDGLMTQATNSLKRALANSHQAWNSVSADRDWLASNSTDNRSHRALSRRRLWLHQKPRDWQSDWEKLAERLLAIDPNFIVWVDWFERRIRGHSPAFDIPDDKRRVEDERLLRRLAAASDQDFWDFGHEYVNATLKGWIDEARVRVAPKPPNPEVEIPPQNRNAISFRQDEDGRIAIDASVSVDQLRTDADARDRHSEAAAEALALLNRCQGNNAAARLAPRLENYLAAIGSSIEEIKPSLLVQRGEKLRQEISAYAVPGTLLDPIADDILVDLRGWQSSHNMLVGLDPVLMAMDTAMLGPDRRPALIPPNEIKQFVSDVQEAGLLAEGTEVILIETADLAPSVPDPNDRRTNGSVEMVRNLMIEMASVALNNPIKSGVIVTGFAGSGLIGGFSIMASIKFAEYLVTHRQWIEDKMGNTPTWQSLIVKVADWLEQATPFKPK